MSSIGYTLCVYRWHLETNAHFETAFEGSTARTLERSWIHENETRGIGRSDPRAARRCASESGRVGCGWQLLPHAAVDVRRSAWRYRRGVRGSIQDGRRSELQQSAAR